VILHIIHEVAMGRQWDAFWKSQSAAEKSWLSSAGVGGLYFISAGSTLIVNFNRSWSSNQLAVIGFEAAYGMGMRDNDAPT
jgi:hypothetical protein